MHRICFSLLRYILQPLPDLTPPTMTKPKSSGSETGYRNVDIASIAVLPVNSKGIRIPLIHHCVMLHFSYFITKFIFHFPTKQLQIIRMLCPSSTSNDNKIIHWNGTCISIKTVQNYFLNIQITFIQCVIFQVKPLVTAATGNNFRGISQRKRPPT